MSDDEYLKMSRYYQRQRILRDAIMAFVFGLAFGALLVRMK